ncbi:MAG: phytanoyl-CoA dioxygenase family protein [Fuerstiella sp.]|jgi:phytanoyl-CoA hydroxylase|nr:phytanoyl-CoA dioxygenase family protein [Fuerstiella sp.]
MNYQQFSNLGYIVVRQFLDGNELTLLTAELARYIGEVVPQLSDAAAFFDDRQHPETLRQLQHMTGDEFFSNYTSHPKWKTLAEELLGEEADCESPEWFNKPPGSNHPTPPHQDNYYFNLTPPNVLTMWVALDAVDAENGCLRYLPGSHKNGARPHERSSVLGFSQGISDYSDQDKAQEVPVHLQPGDVTVHHGWTVHRADSNRSAHRHRRSFAMVFNGTSCERDEEAYRRYEHALATQHNSLGLES